MKDQEVQKSANPELPQSSSTPSLNAASIPSQPQNASDPCDSTTSVTEGKATNCILLQLISSLERPCNLPPKIMSLCLSVFCARGRMIAAYLSLPPLIY